jgi:hypothetical protein
LHVGLQADEHDGKGKARRGFCRESQAKRPATEGKI